MAGEKSHRKYSATINVESKMESSLSTTFVTLVAILRQRQIVATVHHSLVEIITSNFEYSNELKLTTKKIINFRGFSKCNIIQSQNQF